MRLDYSGILQMWSKKRGNVSIQPSSWFFYLIHNMILKFQIWVNYDTQIFFIKDMFEFVAIKSVVVSVADVFMFS